MLCSWGHCHQDKNISKDTGDHLELIPLRDKQS